jgi:uncharacterized membrane protein YdjX (TVP38/TMEM64 family)
MGEDPCRRTPAQPDDSSTRDSQDSSHGSRWWLWLVLLGSLALVLLMVVQGRPWLELLSDVQRVRRFVASFGPWAPLAFIVLETSQVVLAPIPGAAMDLASGYLFGPGWGTLYSMTGLMIGTIIALGLARRLGRPLVERFVPRQTLERFDRYAHRRGVVFFLLLFLAPFTPNDLICFFAGLTSLPLPLLVIVAAVGRFPGVLTTNLIGANLARLTLLQALLIGAPLALAVLGLLRYQAQVEESLLRLVSRLDERLHH